MKKKFFFFTAFAAMTLVGCSSDEPTNGGGQDTPDKEADYLAVNIVAPNGAISRGSEGSLEEGDASESAASNGLFLFFNEAGAQTQLPQSVNDITWKSTPANPYEATSEAVLVISSNKKDVYPTQLLVILNAPADADFANKTLTEVCDMVGNYAATFTDGNLNPLIITNSSYMDGDNVVLATDITGKTFETKDAAKASPVDVYVERVVAKVKIASVAENFAQGAEIEVDGKTVTLTQEINGVEIADVAEKSYLFKNLTGCASWGWANWNDAANHRSYWAVCPEDGMTYANYSWNAITTPVAAGKVFYAQENTGTPRTTKVLVTATLKENGQPCTFLRWAGNYYSKPEFKKQYATLLKSEGFKIKTDGGFRSINPDDFDYLPVGEATVEGTHAYFVANKGFKGYETTVQLTETAKALSFVKAEADCTADDVNNFLAEKTNRVWLWEGGKAYYFVEIEHFGPADSDFAVGVVRNHIYSLALNSLSGPGVAVFDPNEVIIPETPSEDLFYLAATININKWKVVTQTVNFK